MKTPLLFLVLAVTAMAQPNDRDRDRRGAAHEPRVIVYGDADFRGPFLVLGPGDSLENLSGREFPGGGRLNDGISSIRIEGPVELYAYADAGFRGSAMRVTGDLRDLTRRPLADSPRANWNDRISSLRVREISRRDDREPEPTEMIRRVFRDLLSREPNAGDLQHFRAFIVEQNWNERMLREELLRWDEYLDRIINRVCLEVWRRQPDPRELATYRRNFVEQGWSEADLREDLRRNSRGRDRR